MRIEGRYVLAAVMGLALLVLPLFILSYDPTARLERLREPLCSTGLTAQATNTTGGTTLRMPESGILVTTHAPDGKSVIVNLTLFVKPPDQDWQVSWKLFAPYGHEVFVLSQIVPGERAYVRALDASGKWCPADSNELAAPSA
jgi:hypothetical protein